MAWWRMCCRVMCAFILGLVMRQKHDVGIKRCQGDVTEMDVLYY
jgi:hypothetical protein